MPVRTAYVGMDVQLNILKGKKWISGKGTILRLSSPRGTKALVECEDGPKWISLCHLYDYFSGWPLISPHLTIHDNRTNHIHPTSH